MRSPEELGQVDWAALEHAYGSAEDVPELLAALHGDDPDAVDEAGHELVGAVCHQGSVYSASVAAVPFLAHVVRHAPLSEARKRAMVLLFLMAEHEPEEPGEPRRADGTTTAVCAELCRMLPDLLPCLADPDQETRQLALRLVASVADVLPEARRAEPAELLTGILEADAAPAVRADALLALDRFGVQLAFLDSPFAEIRQVSAVLAADRHGPPYPAAVVEVFAADGPSGGPGPLWPVTGEPAEHLTRLLRRDPDAALAVAGRWIAAGDEGSHGSWLAERVAEGWRDREAEVLDLMLAALPHHRDEPAPRLRTVAHWIEHLRTPPAALLDALHAHLDRDPLALLALVRARDPRALDLLPGRPDADLLAEAARLLPAAAHPRLRVLIARQLADCTDEFASRTLVEALGAVGGGTPELTACLREGRAAVQAARVLGRTATATPRLASLLGESAAAEDGALRAAAATAHYRLTGDPALALRAFPELLTDRQSIDAIAELEPLGAAAAPLLPLITPLLADRRPERRTTAAGAHLRITGSPGLPAADLIAQLDPGKDVLRALPLLAAFPRLPEEARPFLRGLAFAPRRLLPEDFLGVLGRTGGGRDDYRARSLALTLLRT
ncbi:hypothetical protein [Kitasatospora sp. NPDC057198]|uniref:hypothetical protein n=1 Tax=Kitasatospora sp. NPDC057198 TaxID=3346046 RepID=UPI0036379676